MKYKILFQVCKICGYTCVEFWIDPESYRKHEEAHNNVDNKQCEVCKKEFGNLASLRWHFRSVHKGETKHKCSLCKYETIYSNGLEIHYRSVHEKKSQKAPKRKKAFQDTSKLLSCDHCEFTSMFSAQLKVHIKSDCLKSVTITSRTYRVTILDGKKHPVDLDLEYSVKCLGSR